MSRGRYRFHLTNGRDALFDLQGTLTRSEARVWSHAVMMAQDAMAGCGSRQDWSGWIIDVHDGRGRRVLLLSLSDVPEIAIAA